MKNYKTGILFILLIAALAVIKLLFLKNPAPPNATAVQPKPAPANVTVYVVKSEKLDHKIFATGTISANEEVDLKAEASGKIVQLLFKEGDKVNKGDLLLKLNDADLLAQKKKLGLQIKLVADKEARQKKLLEIKGISQEDYDASLNALDGLKADMDFTIAQIAKTEIHAPFDGIVGLKSVSEGSYVSPTVKIASIQQIDPVKIDFSVPEKYSGMVRKGAEIVFTIPGFKEEFKGVIYAIEPKIDLATRTLQLRAVCANKERKILPGSFAKINLILNQSANTMMIPTEAIIPELKGQKVFVIKNGMTESRSVQAGLRTDTQLEITQGLEEGDSVIVTGIMQLKTGSPVKISSVK